MIFKRYNNISALPDSYSSLFEQAGNRSFFLTRAWFANFERTVVSQDEQVMIYTAEADAPGNKPIAILPLKLSRKKSGLFSYKSMSSLTNYYSCYFEPIIAADADNKGEVLNGLALALWEDKHHWDVLDLNPLPADFQLLSLLAKTLSKHGMPVQNYFCFGNWYLDVGGRSYQEYLQGLPSVLSKNLPYLFRKIQKDHQLDIEIHTSSSTLDNALITYDNLYSLRWGQSEPYPFFLPGLITYAAATNTLRLGLLFVNGEPSAAQIWFVDQGVASIYKTAFDRRFVNLSVGTLLTAHLMQHVIDVDKVKEVDYLRGDDAYKQNWMPSRRERRGVMSFNPHSVKGLALAARHIGGHSIKEVLRDAHKVIPTMPLKSWRIRS